jgi:hypothetical protein
MDATPPILIVDWKGLKKLGWSLGRTHTWRLMAPTLRKSSGSRAKGTYKEWIEPNPNPFPKCEKLSDNHRSGRVVWPYPAIIAYLKKRGLYNEPK